ncbi:myb/SANT-like domain-containing protein [Artemisia annua]|uniref:Myb/SANT-like domain-containing protein n=1 Tax=Artemisia annua TaxID=35608 RepID=A0A2U1LIY5_ARTAN|nr:myb/SANT-like domain-containing protein [Artemisia annua]
MTLSCSDEWWDKKIQENKGVRSFRKKQPTKELQEAWYNLFGDAVASGVECVAPCMDPSTLNEVHNVDVEDSETIELGEDGDVNSRLENLDRKEESVCPSFLNDFGLQDNSTSPNQCGGSKQPKKSAKISGKHVPMKRKWRESAGSALFKELMREQKDTQQSALQLLESFSIVNQVGTSNVSSIFSVITRLVNQGLMEKYDDLWCFGMNVLKDIVKRDFFLNFPEDEATRR